MDLPEGQPAAVGYGRASDPRVQPHSQARQADALEEYGKTLQGRGIVWLGAYTEGVSGRETEFRLRPVGGVLYRELRRGDHLVVAHFDRLGRSLGDVYRTAECLQLKGIHLHVLQFGGMVFDGSNRMIAQLVMHSLAFAAQWESEMISTRTRDAMVWRREKALPWTPNYQPLGFRIAHGDPGKAGKRPMLAFEPDFEEQELIRRIFRMSRTMIPQHIVRTLKGEGYLVKGYNGKPAHVRVWNVANVQRACEYYGAVGEGMFELDQALAIDRARKDAKTRLTLAKKERRRLRRLEGREYQTPLRSREEQAFRRAGGRPRATQPFSRPEAGGGNGRAEA